MCEHRKSAITDELLAAVETASTRRTVSVLDS